MNVYGSHTGFVWESYANRPAWSVGLFDPESDAAYAQAGGAGAWPGGYFANGGFQDEGRNVETIRDTPAENVPKPVP